MASRNTVQLQVEFNGGAASRSLSSFVTTSMGQFDRMATHMSRRMSAFNQAFNGFSAATKMMGVAGSYFSLNNGLRSVAELEKSMLVVKANIMSGVGSASELNAQLKEVRSTARDIARQTQFTDSQAVDMAGQLLKSGVSLSAVKGKHGALYSTAALAQLGGISPETAAAQMGALGNAFSFKSDKDYYDLANHISRVDDASALNSGRLLYNAQLASATAAQLKIDPKRMFSLIGYVDSLGDMAGTSVNRFYEGLAGTTKGKKKALKQSGMEFWQKNADGTETLKDIGEVVEIVRNKFRGMKSDPEKIILGHKLFGEEGGRVASSVSARDVSFAEFEAKVARSSEAADKLKVAMEGMAAQFSRLKNSSFSALEEKVAGGKQGWLTKGMSWSSDVIENGGLTNLVQGVVGAAIAARLGYKGAKGYYMRANGIPSAVAAGGIGAAAPVVAKAGSSSAWSGLGVSAPKPKATAVLGARALGAIKGTGPLTALFATMGAGFEAYNAYSTDDLTGEQKKKAYKQAAAGATGQIIGSIAGAALGSLLGGWGAIPGAMLGGAAGDYVARKFTKNDAPKIQSQGDLRSFENAQEAPKNNQAEAQKGAAVLQLLQDARSSDAQKMQNAIEQLQRLDILTQEVRNQTEALKALGNRPVQVGIDPHNFAESVNNVNASNARRN